ncbi:MAG: BREX-1 system adenine-specific DNA-methyltransferase PglX [Ideonella sp.]|nr:BREX-1 system adenine-specific DNA-methyltransferase PglX [Ideonella sp.]
MSENQSYSRKQGAERTLFRASAVDFKHISGSPIAYWVGENVRRAFSNGTDLSDLYKPIQGLITGNTERFAKLWHEVGNDKALLAPASKMEALASGRKWFPYNKGGSFRKWYGNNEFVVNWESDGAELKGFKDGNGKLLSRPQNESTYFKEGLTWTAISSSLFAVRYCPEGSIGSNAGMMVFSENPADLKPLLGLLNSSLTSHLMSCLSQTLNFDQGIVSRIPVIDGLASPFADRIIEIAKHDWDCYENSWDFVGAPLLNPEFSKPHLKGSYQMLRNRWHETTLEMQQLEQENNCIFIDAYGLQDELNPEVPLSEITLTCNPHYRYGGDNTEEELEAMLLADTMRELVSYAVGCMLGRYSIDKPSLILANQGEKLADYLEQHRLAQVPQPRFPADDDNVIPVLDGDWFADDITLRFRQFLRVAFGDEHYEGNLAFIEQALNLNGKRNYSLRDYFLREFYDDHVKRYQKRPIYWLFSSPKGSFNALIYMHRYRPDTVSVVLRYLRDFRKKVADEKDRQASASINPAVSQGDRTRALKETDRLSKVLAELDDYERDVMYPLATQQIEIDLDDGVKVNYLKFGAALKKIVGLEAKDED